MCANNHNLILLCRNHHSVVDDDPEAYTVDRLAKMKKNHEEGAASIPTEVIDQGSRLLINQLVTTVNQSGGISAHTVNINSSPSTAPRVGSRVEIKRTGDREHLQFTLVTTLYNDGDAAARKVNGKWKLNISEGLPSVEKTVRMDSLPSSCPFVIDHTIGGTINNPFFSNPNVRIVLEIDLVYLGLKNTEQRYYVIYDYDTTQKTFVPASDDKVGN